MLESYKELIAAKAEIRQLKKQLETFPAADAVEVVRCKDCALRYSDDCAMSYMSEDHNQEYSWESDNDFCSWGKRKG